MKEMSSKPRRPLQGGAVWRLLLAACFAGPTVCFPGGSLFPAFSLAFDASAQFKEYTMDHGYFTCEIPASWQLLREEETDAEDDIYQIELTGPAADKAPTIIFVSYYGKDNEDFMDHENFLARNSTNALGETENERERYWPVKAIELKGMHAFELERERKKYLYPASKSEESICIKEKLFVIPAKEGFYVLHYFASKSVYEDQLPVFDRVVRSFKTMGYN